MDDSAFLDLKLHCNGMLHPAVYRRLYETAKCSGGGTIVEVGTAHAAGTVALARGLKDSGQTGRVYTIERMVGGSRRAFGGLEENLAIVKGNLEHFGVQEVVELLIGEVADLHDKVPSSTPINMLVLDADGRIDRDFMLFFNRLHPQAPIVIDDCENIVRVKSKSRLSFGVDLKKKLTWMLADCFTSKGWIEEGENFRGTLFTTKAASGPVEIDPMSMLKVYRQLVFVEGELFGADGKRVRPIRKGLKKAKLRTKRILKSLGLN